jgi:hypothetical protein
LYPAFWRATCARYWSSESLKVSIFQSCPFRYKHDNWRVARLPVSLLQLFSYVEGDNSAQPLSYAGPRILQLSKERAPNDQVSTTVLLEEVTCGTNGVHKNSGHKPCLGCTVLDSAGKLKCDWKLGTEFSPITASEKENCVGLMNLCPFIFVFYSFVQPPLSSF